MRGTYTYRRLLERFGFDCLRTSQLQKTISQRQSNGGCPLDVLYSLFLAVCACFCTMARKVRLYIYTKWGFRCCSFRLIGQCEGLQTVERATGLALRFLYMGIFLCVSYLLIPLSRVPDGGV